MGRSAGRAENVERETMTTTVLIVDDSKLARIVVGKAIAALQPDWERVEAGNADDALKVLEGRAVDVVVLDYNMPGRSGLDLAEDLRPRFPKMPISPGLSPQTAWLP